MPAPETFRLAVALTDDHRALALSRAAASLGWHGVTIEIADLYLADAPLPAALVELLVDPLLQTSWTDEPSPGTHTVDVAFHPGVTDIVGEELTAAARRAGYSLTAASGRCLRLRGIDDPATLDRLVRRVLANPIIERWTIDDPIPFASAAQTGAVAPVETVAVRGLDAAALGALNRHRGLSLDDDQLAAVVAHFTAVGRDPTDAELETIAQTWSEHCAHTTFRAAITLDDGSDEPPLLDQLRRATDQIAAPWVLNAFAGNAGIISFDGRHTIALKAETHNHPSAVEPFGGANTGVGGVIRDVLGAGHHPIAITDVLCFGPPDTGAVPDGVLHPTRVIEGVIAGVADYGNKIGLPTVAGAVLYDRGYIANPLVYAGCIGVAAADRAPTTGPHRDDRIIVLGGRTGRDGIRGATFSSRTMDAETGEVAGASVQIGDPITEKLLIDALSELDGAYTAITDCGAGGFSSAIGELAEHCGAEVGLDDAPLKYPGLAPWEIWLSEAQERMVLAVHPERVGRVREVCARHGVEVTDLGRFGATDDAGHARLVVRHGGQNVVDLGCAFLHDGRPPRRMRAILPVPPTDAADPGHDDGVDVADALLALLAHPNIASKAAVIHRYDHEIRGATRGRPLVGAEGVGHGDGVVLIEPDETRGIVVGIGVNPWYGLADPQRMAEAAVDEAIRNIVAVGGDPRRVALLDNFSWGDPRRAETLGALVAAVRGCVAASRRFAAPFVSGKDSLNNEYLGADGQRHAVPPTLVITAVAEHHGGTPVSAALTAPGNRLVFVGDERVWFGGSHAEMRRADQFERNPREGDRITGGAVPAPDDRSPTRFVALHEAMRAGLVPSCHDVSEGGVLVAVAEMCIAGGRGAWLADRPAGEWFGERNGSFVVEVHPDDLAALHARLAPTGPVVELGVVADAPALVVGDQTIPLDALRAAWLPPTHTSLRGA